MMLSWLGQNWLALCSLGISVLALTLSYKKFSHDTRPALIIRLGRVENVGKVAAVGVTMSLVERTKRPSARVQVANILKPGEASAIWASDWPVALTEELERNMLLSIEEDVREMDGEDVRYDGKRVARYVLTREGNQILVLKFRAVDGSRSIVRLFSPARSSVGGFTELMPSCRALWNPFGAFVLERRYRRNAELGPPRKFLLHEANAMEEEGTDPGAHA